MINKEEFKVGACNDVSGLLGALVGCWGIPEQELWAIQPGDEQAVRKVIREYTRPFFLELKKNAVMDQDVCNWYERYKEGMRFLINLNEAEEFGWIFNVGQFALAPAVGDEQEFFVWIWEELCGDEDWRIPDMEAYLKHTNPYKNLEIDDHGQWTPKSASP